MQTVRDDVHRTRAHPLVGKACVEACVQTSSSKSGRHASWMRRRMPISTASQPLVFPASLRERRRSPRFACELDVELNGRERARIIDVSCDGLMIVGRLRDMRYALGIRVELADGPIDMMGMVIRHVSDDPPTMGVSLFGLARRDRLRWRAFIANEATLAIAGEVLHASDMRMNDDDADIAFSPLDLLTDA